MQDTHNKHAGIAWLVENDVRSMLKSAQSGTELLRRPPELRIVRKFLEAHLQFVAIDPCLFNLETFDCVFGNGFEVHCRPA